MRSKYIIGIDEVGRGPLAGPVAVGVFAVERKKAKKILKRANDSKKLSEKKREEIFAEMSQCAKSLDCFYNVSLVSAKIIDSKGITFAIKNGIKKSLEKVLCEIKIKAGDVEVLLDGSLSAPTEFTHQKTIIKGDSLEPVIGMASIMAKVTRDRYIQRIAKKYPNYGFEIHKGYGTLMHRKNIEKFGVCDIHRKSWVKGV